MAEKAEKKKISLFGRMTFVASVIMNAISLINIGRDLKITIVRWTEFFLSIFEFGNKVAILLFKPFSFIFDLFNFEVDLTIKQLYSITLITLIGFLKEAGTKKDSTESKGTGESILYILISIPLAAGLALIALIFGWILSFSDISDSPYDIGALLAGLVILSFVLTSILGDDNANFRSYLLKYFGSILLFIFAAALINYFILTMG